MEIFTTTLLVLAITVFVWMLNKVLPFKICPVCAGVSGTWLILTAGILSDLLPAASYQLPIAVLMGGTVVGISYQGEKTLLLADWHGLVWKALVTVVGFPAAYLSLLNMSWKLLGFEVILLSTLLYLFFVRPSVKIKSQMRSAKEIADIDRLERKMEECC